MRKQVIILGGGIAGMSAAHELIERGFQVTVFEKQECLPGGKARSIPIEATATDDRKPLPGEHGFRFFPGFYRHIFDTLKRIPFEEAGGNKTVYENLVECTDIMLARMKQSPIVVPSHFPRSVKNIHQIINSLKKMTASLEPGEVEIIATKMWQLMTSCELRRLDEYERMGWWEFTDAANRSLAYQSLFASGLTRTLVAAKAETCNTKTNGNILLQMIFDFARPLKKNDQILCGPTNETWLYPWLKYLKAKGVDYQFSSVATGLECDSKQISGVWISQHKQAPQKFTADYYLCALPVERAAELVCNPAVLKLDPSLHNIIELKQTVAWMNGIQYYLKKDIPLNKGHIILADSPWALTAISQAQYWSIDLQEYGNGETRGIISVDVSNWEHPGILFNLPAQNCTKDQVIKEVWAQMKACFNVENPDLLQDDYITYVYVDGAILFGDELTKHTKMLRDTKLYEPAPYGSNQVNKNEEPLLVNEVNTWAIRSDAKTDIPNLFLASDYVRTNTDLATMEGANEAARRAVNHILDISGINNIYCKVWRFREPFWLGYYKWLDKRRFRRGHPWKMHKPWFAGFLKLMSQYLLKSN